MLKYSIQDYKFTEINLKEYHIMSTLFSLTLTLLNSKTTQLFTQNEYFLKNYMIEKKF